jgi:hypothetical protein
MAWWRSGGASWLSHLRERPRLVVWVLWPALVFVVSISVIHFLRYRMGWDIHWSWTPTRTAAAALAALVVPAVYELVARRRR